MLNGIKMLKKITFIYMRYDVNNGFFKNQVMGL